MNERFVRASRSRLARALGALCLAVTVSAAAPSRAADLPPYRYVATHCENSYYFIPTTAAQARASVPPRFTIIGEVVGIAIVGVLFVTCDVSLGDGPAERTSWSEVGVLILPPGGLDPSSVAFDFYRTWHVTDRKEWLRLNRAWGIPTANVDVDTSYTPGLPLATSTGDVDDPRGAYGHQGWFEGIVHPGVPGVVRWWTQGRAGLVRIDQEFVNDSEQCGVGIVTAAGRMADLAGEIGLGIHGCVVFADLLGTGVVIEE